MDKKLNMWLVVATLFGVLLGAGVSFGTAIQTLSNVEEDVKEIKTELRSVNTQVDARIREVENRVHAVELKLAKKR